MKLAEEIAEEHYRLPRAIHDLNHPMAKGMLENIVAEKLRPIRDALKMMWEGDEDMTPSDMLKQYNDALELLEEDS